MATELGHALSLKGHEIHFITYHQPVRLNTLQANIHFHEVTVPDYPLFQYQPYELALSSKLVQVVKQEQLELLHVHYAIPHAYAAYMAQKMLEDQGISIPFVTTLHGTDITLVGSHPFYKDAVAFSINNEEHGLTGRFELAALAKREETIFRKNAVPLILDRKGRVMVHARDEAHRFVNTFHRKRRSRRKLNDPLGEVEGLGAKKMQNLLRHFGGRQGIAHASLQDLKTVPGIGPSLAMRIHSALHE